MNRFLTRAWIAKHVVVLVMVVVFCGLGYWQFTRATGGNMLSWAYVFEWPLFAFCAIAVWIREVREELKKGSGWQSSEPPMTSSLVPVLSVSAPESTGDVATDQYNHYLSWLAENPARKPHEYPG